MIPSLRNAIPSGVSLRKAIPSGVSLRNAIPARLKSVPRPWRSDEESVDDWWDRELTVLWLIQNRPDDISVGRRLIAENLAHEGVDVTLRPATPGNVRRSLAEAGSYDAVVGTTRAGAIAGSLVSRVHGVPLLVDVVDTFDQFVDDTSPLVHWPVLALENLSFRLAEYVVFGYERERPRVERHAGRYVQVRPGVSYGKFADPDPEVCERTAREVDELGWDHTLLYVGGLEPIYHVEEMLEAVERLDGWGLLVVGDGALTDRVEDAAAERDDVAFFGTVPHEEIPGYNHAADVGIALVDDQRTIKVREYMAAGLPVVQLDGEARDRYGDLLSYCSTDPDDVARAIEAAYRDSDPEAIQAHAAGYSWRSVAQQYAESLRVITDRQ